MSNESYLTILIEKHRALDKRVEEATRSPGIDSLELVALKREKLRLKEEIEILSSKVETTAA